MSPFQRPQPACAQLFVALAMQKQLECLERGIQRFLVSYSLFRVICLVDPQSRILETCSPGLGELWELVQGRLCDPIQPFLCYLMIHLP